VSVFISCQKEIKYDWRCKCRIEEYAIKDDGNYITFIKQDNNGNKITWKNDTLFCSPDTVLKRYWEVYLNLNDYTEEQIKIFTANNNIYHCWKLK